LQLKSTSAQIPEDTLARVRDKLTIADVCADLAINRSTFYEWRAKGRAPRCIKLPNGDIRITRSEYERWLNSLESGV
jgi:predicted DNA-binding transcriptional regulator AlpA